MIRARAKALAHGGAFVCEVTGADGAPMKKAFIREVIPGELVEAELIEEKKSFIEARLTRILEPSPSRVEPPCPLFGRCGGCDLQHIQIAEQRQAKFEMVKDTLRLHGGLIPEEGFSLIGADLPHFKYRKRIMLHCDPAGFIGFYRQKSGEVVDTETCLLAGDGINRTLRILRNLAASFIKCAGSIVLEEHENEVFVALRLHDDSRPLTEVLSPIIDMPATEVPNLVVSQRRRTVYARYRGSTLNEAENFPFPVGHFSQINQSANDLLVSTVVKEAASPEVTDLYAGAGNFSLPLASRGCKVTAVELDGRLTTFGQEIARRENLQGLLSFETTSCERYLRRYSARETVVLDPPRQGAAEVVKYFSPEATSRIVYVSCSLPTLCRDLKILGSRSYRLRRVSVIDMFPQTHHVETVSVLSV